MIAYLDTQVVVWIMQGETKQISRQAKRLLDTADLLISPMVIVELELLREMKRIKLAWRDVQADVQFEMGIRICDLPFPRIAYISLAESWTCDPFDRIIVAHARANGFAFLISADEEIRKHYQRAVW